MQISNGNFWYFKNAFIPNSGMPALMTASVGFHNQSRAPVYTLPGSDTEQVLLLSNTSNVGEPGVWVFRVDSVIGIGVCCVVL